MIARLIPGLMVLLSLGLYPSQASAHSVQTDYRLIAESLEVQSSFSTGESFGGAVVTVYAPNDTTHPWLQGMTDAQGKFLFQPDRTIPGEWSVSIGGTGDHGDRLTVPVTDRGVELDAISQAPYAAPHPLAQQITQQMAQQITVGGLVLGSSLGVGWWGWRRRSGL